MHKIYKEKYLLKLGETKWIGHLERTNFNFKLLNDSLKFSGGLKIYMILWQTEL